jgi:hypothetical protein
VWLLLLVIVLLVLLLLYYCYYYWCVDPIIDLSYWYCGVVVLLKVNLGIVVVYCYWLLVLLCESILRESGQCG